MSFTGEFQANPSTINNFPQNYDEKQYSGLDDLQGAALVWNPSGDGGFGLRGCVVSRIDYAPGDYAVSSDQDPLIGQPVTAVKDPSFPLPATIVDLDPQQQMVSEVWGLNIQIGGDTANVAGAFVPAAFTNLWGQAPFPRSSASSSAVYQSALRNLQFSGDIALSKCLKMLQTESPDSLSINFVVNGHNNNPELYIFTEETLKRMGDAGVKPAVLKKLQPLTKLNMKPQPSLGGNGLLPTQTFTIFAVKNVGLTTEEYNASIDAILKGSRQRDYVPSRRPMSSASAESWAL